MNKFESLEGKKILFLAPAFFGYEIKLKQKMEEMGAEVDYYDERSVSSAFNRALLKISSVFFVPLTRVYYQRIIEQNQHKKYDFVFIIKCDMISSDILEKMKSAFKNAVFCLYLFDSTKNIPNVTQKFHYFDRVITFDPLDAKKHPELKFRPLFYIDDFKLRDAQAIRTDYEYDVCFCGTIHSDRYKIIKDVKQFCTNYDLHFYGFLYMQSKFVYWLYRLFKSEFRSTKITDFDFEKLSSVDISRIVEKSKIILDIQHPKQTGLTMRTIEMIGMNKKLITTNEDIVNYDFYNPNNILVISRDFVQVPRSFMDSTFEPLNQLIYDKYSIESWINDVLINKMEVA